MSDDTLNYSAVYVDPTATDLSVTTDQADYHPGDTAIITATNVTAGASVEFSVAHVQAGADGVYGTADDLYTYDLDGTGKAWTVTDGGNKDADGIVNGSVLTSWFVNLDALNQSFVVTATDLTSGVAATAAFTDTVTAGTAPSVDLTSIQGLAGDIAPPAGADNIIVNTPFNGAIFTNDQTISAVVSGSGNLQSFVRVQSNDPTEEGYNTDGRPLEFDENNTATFTHDLPLLAIPLSYLDLDNNGTLEVYYQFRLDVNESNTTLAQWLSLDDIEIWQSDTAGLLGFTPAGNQADGFVPGGGVGVPGFAAVTDDRLAWNLDAGDLANWVALEGTYYSGSGDSDMVLLVPTSYFDQNLDFIYLYSGFGFQAGTNTIVFDDNYDGTNDSTVTAGWANDSGFEEWAIISGAPATKSGTKFLDINADGSRDANGADNILGNADDEVGLSGWTIYAYADDDGDAKVDATDLNHVLDAGESLVASTVTAADGSYSFVLTAVTFNNDGDIVSGGYIILEEARAGWAQTAPGTDVVEGGSAPGANQNGYGIVLSPGERETGNDFGNYQLATKSGTKFLDRNADGSRDANGVDNTLGNADDEVGLSGWTITITGTAGDGSVVNTSAVTDASGNYSFTVKPGSYTVDEVLKAGWVKSYPDVLSEVGDGGTTDGDWDIVLTTGQTDTGNDFGNYQNATKSGTKFLDRNDDGSRDADGVDNTAGNADDEVGLSGWTITITGTAGDGSVVNTSAVTDASGNYSFVVKPGAYAVDEVLKAGWVKTYPDVLSEAGDGGTTDGDWDIVLTSGQTDTGNDFGNVQLATKSGTKFLDRNADGSRDADGVDNTAGNADDEVGLSGWTITITGTAGDGSVVNTSALTDASGNYSFTVKPGSYTVNEVLQAGWVKSYPDVLSEVGDGGTTDGDWDIVLTSGQTDTGNDFGNYQNATKSGTKFLDRNDDGSRDADGVDNTAGNADDEVGLSGWTITITGTAGDGSVVNTSAVTDTSGNYSFVVKPGAYTVDEVLKAGWVKTYPDVLSEVGDGGTTDGDWDIVLTSGQTDTGNDFGNVQLATKSGTKFLDRNADGSRDADGVDNTAGNADDEVGLSGWTITITGTAGDGSVVNTSALTDASGNYSFVVKPGSYTVNEVLQAGWVKSYPDVLSEVGDGGTTDGDWDIVLTSGQTDTGNDFGNYQNATKSGTKFLDRNADGSRDADGVDNTAGNADDEVGLSGWTITITGTAGDGSVVNTSAVTDASGNYSFVVKPGAYTVDEVLKAGWVKTYPDVLSDAGDSDSGATDGDWDIVLTSGQTDTGNDFGNFQLAVKSGTKFLDRNADGSRDADGVDNTAGNADDEVGLSGWTITITGTAGDGSVVNTSALTDASGNYSFTVKPGSYTVNEVLQAGWVKSYPDVLSEAGDGGTTDGDWDIVLTTGQTDTGNDFGNYQNATKSGTKFLDRNADGSRDADGVDNTAGNADDEVGLSGWTITITGTAGDGSVVNTSALTDASGNYSFVVKPGSYTVNEVLQAGWVKSYPDVLSEVGDGGTTDGDWDIVLTSGQTDTGNDFGNYQNATKSGTKFLDRNADGSRDADGVDNTAGNADDEVGLSGWTITITGTAGDGSVVNTSAVTDASGNYSFVVKPGAYTVDEVLKAGWVKSYPDVLSDAGDSDSGATDGDWDIVLTSGQTDAGNDFGNYQNATKSGTKFLDRNADGSRDADGVDNTAGNADDEVGLSGWTITITGTAGDGSVVNTSAVTDASGNYSFVVKPGAYTVDEVLQAGWVKSYPDVLSEAGDGGTTDGDWDIVLTSGQTDTGNDFGNYQNATKSGTKFLDRNADGSRDADGVDNTAGNADDEVGLSGWTITITGTAGDGSVVNTSAVTDASGNYSFVVKPGAYTVNEVLKAGWVKSYPDVLSDAGDSDSGATDGDWDIVLTSGQTDTGNDFGNYQNATKSGTKFLDRNADGSRDADGVDNTAGNADDEVGLSGWTITITGTAGDGSVVNTSAVTDASGNYSFVVKPGAYTVDEVLKAGWVKSYPDVLSDAGDSDSGATDGDWDIVLTSGQTDTGNDFGNYQNATKSGTKFLDQNADGSRDADGVDNTAGNADDEVGLSGWTITITGTAGDGSVVNTSAVTDASGNYSFVVKPGAYTVDEVLKTGWIKSYPDVLSEVGDGGTTDGDWDIVLTSGQTDTGNDFGNYANGSIHGFKFLDSNGDGLVNNGETGMTGITITLFGDTDGDGDTETISTTTDANGKFHFYDLHPGTYTVTELFSDDGVTYGATVDHDDPDDVGDNHSTVTVNSGQELVAYDGDADIPNGAPQHEVNVGDALIFGNVPVGGCGLSPGFWAQHLYLWDGIENNGPRDHNGTGEYLANKLAAAGTVEEPEMMDLFPQHDTDGVPGGTNVVDVDGDGKTDLVFETDDGRCLIIEWDDAQQIINQSNNKGGDKLGDFTRMTINTFLNNIGVPDFDAPADVLSDAAKWLLANANIYDPAGSPAPVGDCAVLKYNNTSEPNNPASPQDGGPKDGFNKVVTANSTAWSGSGAGIFQDLTQLICSDDPANPTGSNLQLSADGSIVLLGVCYGDWFGVIDATANIPGGYHTL